MDYRRVLHCQYPEAASGPIVAAAVVVGVPIEAALDRVTIGLDRG